MTFKPYNWARILDPATPWDHCYPKVAAIAQDLINRECPFPKTIGTTALAELLFPVSCIKTDLDVAARKRLFKALSAIGAHDLAAYVTLGEPRRMYSSKLSHPRLWGAPASTEKWVNVYAEQDAKQAIEDDITKQMGDL